MGDKMIIENFGIIEGPKSYRKSKSGFYRFYMQERGIIWLKNLQIAPGTFYRNSYDKSQLSM